nr:(2Fe-2S)-binding protein [uncultured Halomonas sp.]
MATSDDQDKKWRLTRRSFLQGTAAAAGGLTSAFHFSVSEAQAQAAPPPAPGDLVTIRFQLNGSEVRTAVDPRRTLLDYLREQAELTGTKVGCRHGQCGACTVHVDGVARLSCLTLAAQLEGAEVTTIEGLADAAIADGIATEDGLHPLQAAFIAQDGFQCGYCTPGQLMSGASVIALGHAGSAASVREYMSGNLCRCGAYPGITAAVLETARTLDVPQQGGGARSDYHLGLIETTADTLDEISGETSAEETPT